MDRRPSLADILNPEQIRQYMAEAGYAPPTSAYPVPPPMDVPVAPPADLVEYRGTIEFQAHWELPAVANRSRDELIGDILSTLGGQEAAWLPRLRYRVADLRRIDPHARPAAPALDPRPRWRHPTNGTVWRVNQDGSLDPESSTPPVATPNAWIAADVPASARHDLSAVLRDMKGEDDAYEQRIDGLERLATDLATQLADMEAQRAHRRETRRQRRLHGGDVRADEHDPSPPSAADVRDAVSDAGGRGASPEYAADDEVPGDDGDRLRVPAESGPEADEATPDGDEGRPARSKRKSPLTHVESVQFKGLAKAYRDERERQYADSLPESE